MSTEKFTAHRGIKPIQWARVWLPHYILSMEIPGVPYSEPGYASIRRRGDSDPEMAAPDVVGIAYELTTEQYQRVIASEGGQIAYQDITVVVKPADRTSEERIGSSELTVRTLGSTSMVRRPEPVPSERYMVSGG